MYASSSARRCLTLAVLTLGLLAAAPASARGFLGKHRPDSQLGRLIGQLERGTEDKKVAAAKELGRKRVTVATPALIRSLGQQRRVREAASEALLQLGKRALPALKEALAKGPKKLRPEVARVLGRMDKPREQVVAALCSALLDEDRDTRHAAVKSLRRTDQSAVLGLLRAWVHNVTHASDIAMNNALVELMRRMGKLMLPRLRLALKSPDPALAEAATHMLHYVGPTAAPTIRATLLKHPVDVVRAGAAGAAAQLDGAASVLVPALARALRRDRTSKVRVKAAEALFRLGARAKVAGAALLAALADRHPHVRRAAASALERVPVPRKDVVAGLRPLLADRDRTVRKAAIPILGRLGSAAAKVVPQLVRLFADHDLREPAIRAVGSIGRNSSAVRAALHGVLRSRDHHARNAAAWALGKLRPIHRSSISALIRALRNEADSYVQEVMVAALGDLGPAAAAATPDLLRAVDGAGFSVARAAGKALGKMGPRAVARLNRALRHQNRRVVDAAVKALGEIGPRASPALPRLIQLLDKATAFKADAAVAIGKLGSRAAPAVAALLRALDNHPSSPLAKASIVALGRIGRAASRAAPRLGRAVGERHDSDAAVALARIGSAAVPSLRRLLTDRRPIVVAHAAWAVGRIGPRARAAIPELVGLLTDLRFVPSGTVRYLREAAALALGLIGRPIGKATAALVGLLDDRRASVRRAAAETLGIIARPAAAGIVARLERMAGDAKEQKAVREAARAAIDLLSRRH